MRELLALVPLAFACHEPPADSDVAPDTDAPAPRVEALGDAPVIVRGALDDSGLTVGAGRAVAIGDIDADGAGDLIVGAPYASRACGGFPEGTSTLAGARICVTGSPGEYVGTALLAGVDLDDDGTSDLVIGSPGVDAGLSDRGAVDVRNGPLVSGPLPGFARFVGAAALDGAGTSLSAGDLDGDGHVDLVIGAPGNDGGAAGGGAIYVVLGPIAAQTRDLADADIVFEGSDQLRHGTDAGGDTLGTSAVVLGDVDGDGIDDLGAGAGGSDRYGPSTGLVLVWKGPLAPGAHTPDEADLRLWGPTEGGYLGEPVAAAGDVDGDGRADLLASANGAVPHQAWLAVDLQAGEAAIVEAAATTFRSADTDGLGWAMAAADLDQDGDSDVILGAPWDDRAGTDAGAVYALLAPIPPGTVEVGTAVRTWLAEAPSDAGGLSLGVGDLDGDGTADVAIGAPFSSVSAGAAYAVGLSRP